MAAPKTLLLQGVFDVRSTNSRAQIKKESKQFENSQDTAEFILTINLLDMLNSKSKYGKNCRSLLKLENLDETQHFLNDTIDYFTKR